ncbi:MAG: acyltransferase family protein [Acidimicrobiales bacterium]
MAVRHHRAPASTPAPAKPAMGYQPGLDGLRAIAVLAVVAFHYRAPLPGGWLGVNLFFVISGYLITRLLMEEQARHGGIHLRSFYRRRAARLLPAMYLIVGVFLVISLFVPSPNHLADVRGAVTGWLYMANIDRYFGQSNGGMFGHLWSLSLEEQFYACWPLVVTIIHRKGRAQQTGRIAAAASAGLFALLVVRALWWFNLDQLYNGIEGQGMACLLLGCAWGAARSTRQWPALLTIASAVIVVVAACVMPYDSPASFVLLPLVALAMLVLVNASLRGGILAPLMGNPVLQHLGRLSYGIYLIHSCVRLVLVRGFGGPLSPAWTIAAAAITLALAELSYRGFEQPLRRRLSRDRPPSALSASGDLTFDQVAAHGHAPSR